MEVILRDGPNAWSYSRGAEHDPAPAMAIRPTASAEHPIAAPSNATTTAPMIPATI